MVSNHGYDILTYTYHCCKSPEWVIAVVPGWAVLKKADRLLDGFEGEQQEPCLFSDSPIWRSTHLSSV